MLWLFSQAWITSHIWFPHSFRLAPTEKLFVTPMYNALLIDQSLALNRRKNDQPDLSGDVSRSHPDVVDGGQQTMKCRWHDSVHFFRGRFSP